jgi:hypothetical protein
MRVAAAVALILAAAAGAHAAERCPATQPPAPAFVPPAPYSAAPSGDQAFLFGTNDLWVSVQKQPWHGLSHKLFWWRPGFNGAQEHRPNLSMTIRRIDSAVTTSVDRPATNAHFGGEWSMLILAEFPEAGCWEIRGTYGGRSVTFVAAIEP